MARARPAPAPASPCRPRSEAAASRAPRVEWRSAALRACRRGRPGPRSCSRRRAVPRPTGPVRPSRDRWRGRRSRRRPSRSSSALRTEAGIGGGRSASIRIRPAHRPAPRWRRPGRSRDCAAGRPSCPNDGHGRAARPTGRNWKRRASRGTASAGRRRGAARRRRSAGRPTSASRWRAQKALSPGEPVSSPISIRILTLKPSRPPRAARTRSSASRSIVCWPLLSAVPRPYQRSPSTVTSKGARPGRQAASWPSTVSPWP